MLRETPGVRLAGYVDDVSPYFERARALVVPLRSGGGMRVKILETLARGLPVVSTSIGHEGIDAVPGVHLLAADTPAAFAAEVRRAFQDDALVARLARAGRELALDRYDTAVVGAELRRALSGFHGQPRPVVQVMIISDKSIRLRQTCCPPGAASAEPGGASRESGIRHRSCSDRTRSPDNPESVSRSDLQPGGVCRKLPSPRLLSRRVPNGTFPVAGCRSVFPSSTKRAQSAKRSNAAWPSARRCRRWASRGLEVIVVDDGSTDRTADRVREYPQVRLIQHPVNRGYGAALKTGFEAAAFDLIGFLDADATYPPEEFPALCRPIIEGRADLVIGSRMLGADSEMPLVRRIGNTFFATLLSLVGRSAVTDSASGMRVFRRETLGVLSPLPDGLNLTPVMSTRAVHERIAVLEVPISVPRARRPLEAERDAGRPAVPEDDRLDDAHLQPGAHPRRRSASRASGWPRSSAWRWSRCA